MNSNVENTLVYVDRELAIGLAAKLVGILASYSNEKRSKAGLNWLVSAGVEAAQTGSYQNDVREMLPEDLMYYLYPKIQNKFNDISSSLRKLATTSSESLVPGDALTISGNIVFPQVNETIEFTPESNFELDIPAISFHGEDCFLGYLSDAQYKIPVYFPKLAMYQVMFCQNQPVEITGIVKWVPPYSPSGANALNLAIRAAALWLR